MSQTPNFQVRGLEHRLVNMGLVYLLAFYSSFACFFVGLPVCLFVPIPHQNIC